MKFQFNEYTDQVVAIANEWKIVYRRHRFYIITNVHRNVVAHCGSLENAMSLGHTLLD